MLALLLILGVWLEEGGVEGEAVSVLGVQLRPLQTAYLWVAEGRIGSPSL